MITNDLIRSLDVVEKQYKKFKRYVGLTMFVRAIFSNYYGGQTKSWETSIFEVLNTLTDRERTLLTYRFGLQDGECLSLEGVAKKFGVTRERIRQIEGKALRKLRHPTRKIMMLGASWQIAAQEAKEIGEKLLLHNVGKLHTDPKLKLPRDYRKIDELDLPTRIINTFLNNGYQYVWQLKEAENKDLFKLKNIGYVSINILREKIK